MSKGWDPKSPSLRRTIVCYADILGFRDLTRSAFESGEETEFLRRIKRSIDAAYEEVRTVATLEGVVPPIFHMKVFTDNFLVAYPLSSPSRDRGEPELGTFLMLFPQVQASLAAEGLFLRGAIAEGQHYDIVYGDALLEAVNLDKSGRLPRLVMASSVERLQGALHGAVPSHHRTMESSLKTRMMNDCSLTTSGLRLSTSLTVQFTISFSRPTAEKCVDACGRMSSTRVSGRSTSGLPPITTTFAAHSPINI